MGCSLVYAFVIIVVTLYKMCIQPHRIGIVHIGTVIGLQLKNIRIND